MLAGKPLGAHPQVWMCMGGILATAQENATLPGTSRALNAGLTKLGVSDPFPSRQAAHLHH